MMSSLSQLVVAIFAAYCLPGTVTKPIQTDNDRPIIGIMTQTVTDPSLLTNGNVYITATYVKYLESAGARVVPVLVNQTDDYYTMLYKSLNGILFPGGDLTDVLDSGFGKAAKFFYNQAIKGFDSSGDHFPLWGTCEGFQLLTMLTAQKDLLANTDTEHKTFPLTLSSGYKKSRMFGPSTMPDDVLHMLTKENVTFNAHHWSITQRNFSSNSALKNFYRIISTNIDDNGVEFLSTIEAFKYPIYGVQWHPEQNIFHWTDEYHIPHGKDAVRVVQHMANFFVEEARKSSHKFSSEDEEAKYLIYNFNPINTGNIRDGKQTYFWTI